MSIPMPHGLVLLDLHPHLNVTWSRYGIVVCFPQKSKVALLRYELLEKNGEEWPLQRGLSEKNATATWAIKDE